MDRTKKTLLESLGILLLFFILGLVVYFAGSGIAKTFLKAGGASHAAWSKKYFNLAMYMTVIACVFTYVWYLMARFLLKIHGPQLVGKRTIWAVIGVVNILACIVFPYFYTRNDGVLKLHVLIYVLFILLLGIVGYYVASLFATPACYKYTPLGARMVRSAQFRKRRAKE